MVLGLQYCLIQGKLIRILREKLKEGTFTGHMLYPGGALHALARNSEHCYQPCSTDDEIEAN